MSESQEDLIQRLQAGLEPVQIRVLEHLRAGLTILEAAAVESFHHEWFYQWMSESEPFCSLVLAVAMEWFERRDEYAGGSRDPEMSVCYYRRQDYPRFREMCADGEFFPPTFRDWEVGIHRSFSALRASGFFVHAIPLDPDTFAAWCRARRLPMDAHARRCFAIHRRRREREAERQGLWLD